MQANELINTKIRKIHGYKSSLELFKANSSNVIITLLYTFLAEIPVST